MMSLNHTPKREISIINYVHNIIFGRKHLIMPMTINSLHSVSSRNMKFTYQLLVALILLASESSAFTTQPPVFGIGALLFKGTVKLTPSLGDDKVIIEAADFFVDAFWQAKVGGGTKQLTEKQRASLMMSQTTDFRKRYGLRVGQRRSEIVIARNKNNTIMGVCAIEVQQIQDGLNTGQSTIAPLMSNVAVGKKFRRRGLAEDMVKEVEEIARKGWGYNEVYLYVEDRNKAAVRLYQKLGYRKIWTDDTSRTLIPTTNGGWDNAPTLLVCMKKNLNRGLLGRFLPF
jgi:ribosomal protein S18 acetylase RimI-like enzyme